MKKPRQSLRAAVGTCTDLSVADHSRHASAVVSSAHIEAVRVEATVGNAQITLVNICSKPRQCFTMTMLSYTCTQLMPHWHSSRHIKNTAAGTDFLGHATLSTRLFRTVMDI